MTLDDEPDAETFFVVDADARRPYIDVTYRTRSEAEASREDLLRHFPANHEWRRRLVVRSHAEMTAPRRRPTVVEPTEPSAL